MMMLLANMLVRTFATCSDVQLALSGALSHTARLCCHHSNGRMNQITVVDNDAHWDSSSPVFVTWPGLQSRPC